MYRQAEIASSPHLSCAEQPVAVVTNLGCVLLPMAGLESGEDQVAKEWARMHLLGKVVHCPAIQWVGNCDWRNVSLVEVALHGAPMILALLVDWSECNQNPAVRLSFALDKGYHHFGAIILVDSCCILE